MIRIPCDDSNTFCTSRRRLSPTIPTCCISVAEDVPCQLISEPHFTACQVEETSLALLKNGSVQLRVTVSAPQAAGCSAENAVFPTHCLHVDVIVFQCLFPSCAGANVVNSRQLWYLVAQTHVIVLMVSCRIVLCPCATRIL